MGVWSNKISKRQLKAGDHIYTWRKSKAWLIAHHGIYVGDEKTIHFTRSKEEERGVVLSTLDEFLGEDELYRYEYEVSKRFFIAKTRGGTCTLARSYLAEDVLRRANHLLEVGFKRYNLFENNCESFALYCKTGLIIIRDPEIGGSGQLSALIGGAFLVTGMNILGYADYSGVRLHYDVGFRMEHHPSPQVRATVKNIPVEELVNVTDLRDLAREQDSSLESNVD